MSSMCTSIENTGLDPIVEKPTWDTEGCCLRVGAYRFPPYVDFAGGDLFPDLEADVYHMCGSVIEAVKILMEAVNCTCMRVYHGPAVFVVEGQDGIKYYDQFDLRLVADYAYSAPELIGVQVDHYPLGSLSVTSIMGRENVTPARGISILDLYSPGVWLNFCCSILALTLVLRSIACRKKVFASNPWGQSFAEFLYVLAINWGQSFGGSSINGPSMLLRLKTLIVGIWSLLSAYLLTKAATADLLELLMYEPGTDRFVSMEDLIKRSTNSLLVVSFDKTPLSEAIQENGTLVPNYKIMSSDDDLESYLVGMLGDLVANKAVLVGAASVLTYLKSSAVNLLGYEDYKEQIYIQQDLENSMPYYVKTSRHWPSVKLAQWRRASAVLLESGMSEFAYKRSLAESIPDVLRQEAKEGDEKAQILTAGVIKLWSIYKILIVCSVLVATSVVILLVEDNTHSAHVYPYS